MILTRKESYKSFFNIFNITLIVVLFSACDDGASIEDIVRFERVSDLTWERNDVGTLEVLNNRLYYSNFRNPGYLKTSNNRKQFGIRPYDMNFGHFYTSQFAVGVERDRESLVLVSHVDYNSLATILLNRNNIPNIPPGFRLLEGAPNNQSFGMNGEFLLSSWENQSFSDNPEEEFPVFILELNTNSDGLTENGLVVDRVDPIANKIPVLFTESGNGVNSLLSVFLFEKGWIASGNVSGNQISFLVDRDGTVTPIRSDNQRFVITSFAKNINDNIFLTTEDGLYFSQTGNPLDLTRIDTFDSNLKVRILGERMFAWGEGERIFEVKDYNSSSEISLVELENVGLEEANILNLAYFDGDFYVATDNGLFLKNRNDFLTEKRNSSEIDIFRIGN